VTEADTHVADDAWESTVVLHDQNDIGAPIGCVAACRGTVRQLRAGPAAMTRVGDAVEREVERRWAQVDGVPDDSARP
jgi:hypothetical protein